MGAEMDWNDVRYFLALARDGSVRAAGSSLGVSHSTVARRVEALEEKLAVRLFDRSRDGYALTDAGARMLPGAERIERELAAMEREVVGRDARLEGPVAITCCDPWISAMLIHEMAGFCERHPAIELAFTVDGRPFDLSRREADLAIRILGRPSSPPDHLIARRLAPMLMGTYVGIAHRDHLDPERGGRATRWVAFDDRALCASMVADSSYPDLPLWGSFASLELMVQAGREGLGLVMLPTYVGDQEPGLVRAERADLRHMADLWLLCHPDLRTNARIRAARLHVGDAMTRRAPFFAGETPESLPRPTSAPGCPEIAPGRSGPSSVG